MTAEQEELLPKPRRGRTTKPTGEELPIINETHPGPIEEPPPASGEELVAIEAALDIFSDDMSPAERAKMEAEIKALSPNDARAKRGLVEAPKEPTLAEKIVLVMEAIDAVEKLGRNEAQKYAYQRATDVTKEVRREFIKQGLVFVTDIKKVKLIQIPRDRGTPNIIVVVKGKFTITDGVDKISFKGAGMGQDVGDKGIYKAITGMLKYGLRTLLLLPDEKDDPEVARQDELVEAGIQITSATIAGVKVGGRQSQATSAQINAIKEAARELMLSPEGMAAHISSTLGSGPALDPMDDTNDQAKQVMAYLESLSFDDCGKVARVLVEAVPTRGGE